MLHTFSGFGADLEREMVLCALAYSLANLALAVLSSTYGDYTKTECEADAWNGHRSPFLAVLFPTSKQFYQLCDPQRDSNPQPSHPL